MTSTHESPRTDEPKPTQPSTDISFNESGKGKDVLRWIRRHPKFVAAVGATAFSLLGGAKLIDNIPTNSGPKIETVADPNEAAPVAKEERKSTVKSVLANNEGLVQPTIDETIGDVPYEEMLKPSQLSADQLTEWESGDQLIRSAIAYELMQQKFTTAMLQVEDADRQGRTADISYFTDDANVYAEIQSAYQLVNENTPDENANAYYVCNPADTDPMGLCDPEQNVSSETGEPLQTIMGSDSEDVYVTVKYTEGNSVDALYTPEYFASPRPNFHYEVSTDGVLKAVMNS